MAKYTGEGDGRPTTGANRAQGKKVRDDRQQWFRPPSTSYRGDGNDGRPSAGGRANSPSIRKR